MEKTQLNTIIGGIIGLTGTIVGFLLQFLSNYLSEKKRVANELFSIKALLHSATHVNQLYPELLRLRYFFMRYPNSLKNRANMDFFNKWLREPLLEDKFKDLSGWYPPLIEEMLNDLDNTKS